MPVDLGSTIKKTSQWTFNSSIMNDILSNSIVLALVIAFIMILIVMVIYPAKRGTPLSLVFKMFVYMFLSSSVLIFLHDGVIKHMFNENMRKSNDDGTFDEVFNRDKKINLVDPVEVGLDSMNYQRPTVITPASITVPQEAPNPYDELKSSFSPSANFSSNPVSNPSSNTTGNIFETSQDMPQEKAPVISMQGGRLPNLKPVRNSPGKRFN